MLDHAPADVARDGHKSLLARRRLRELCNARVSEVVEAYLQLGPLERRTPGGAPRFDRPGRVNPLAVGVLPLDARCFARREHVVVSVRLD